MWLRVLSAPQRGADASDLWQQQLTARLRQQACVAQVVEIFRSAGKVHELQVGGRGAGRGQLLPDVILNRLDVMINALLDGFDSRGRRVTRVVGQCRRAGLHTDGQRRARKLWQRRGQCQQPAGLDTNALAYQAGFRKQRPQRRHRSRVATIKGGNSL